MKRLAILVALAAAAVTAASAFAGCASSSKSDAVRLSRKGEACQFTNECDTGLSCLPRPGGTGGVCVTGEFNIAATAKECAQIQCDQAADCCPPPPSNCTTLDQECKAGGTSAQTYCDEYAAQCVCDTKSWSCTNGACKFSKACTTDTQCASNACVSGTCAECKTNDQCGGGNTCVNGKCVEGCSLDSDCPSFYRCQNSQCVAGTCQSDRECVAATGNVQAKCNANEAKCVVPCETDLECGSSQDYQFYSCIQNECIYTGCDSDKECELYLGRSSGLGSSGNPPPGSSGSSGSSGTSGTSGTSGVIPPTTKKARIVCRDVPATQ